MGFGNETELANMFDQGKLVDHVSDLRGQLKERKRDVFELHTLALLSLGGVLLGCLCIV